MAKNDKDTQTNYRDSKTAEFITQRQADRKDPATWERERIHHAKKLRPTTTQYPTPASRIGGSFFIDSHTVRYRTLLYLAELT
jgi:hypothetical protein